MSETILERVVPADQGVPGIDILGDRAHQAGQARVEVAGQGPQTRCAQGAHQGVEPVFANDGVTRRALPASVGHL